MPVQSDASHRAWGRRVGRKRVARLMRGMGLAARRRRRFPRTTDSWHALPIAPNLLLRNFTAAAPNRAWLADLTCIRTAEGWLHLAPRQPLAAALRDGSSALPMMVLDLHSRRVVGWAPRGPKAASAERTGASPLAMLADHLGHELALAALDIAIARQRPAPGLIHHADRGVQHAAHG